MYVMRPQPNNTNNQKTSRGTNAYLPTKELRIFKRNGMFQVINTYTFVNFFGG